MFQQLMVHFKDSFTTQHKEFHIQPWSDRQQCLHLGQVSFTKKCTHISPTTKISYHKLVYKTVTGFIEINTNRKLHRFFILTNGWHFQSVPTLNWALNTTVQWHSCHVLIPPGPQVRLRPKQHDQHALDHKCWLIPQHPSNIAPTTVIVMFLS